MKLRYTAGTKVYKLNDPHAGVAVARSTELRGPANLVTIEWPDGETERVLEDELRSALGGSSLRPRPDETPDETVARVIASVQA